MAVALGTSASTPAEIARATTSRNGGHDDAERRTAVDAHTHP